MSLDQFAFPLSQCLAFPFFQPILESYHVMMGTCPTSTVLSLTLFLLVEFAFSQLSFHVVGVATTTTPLASPLAIGDKVVAKKRHALDL